MTPATDRHRLAYLDGLRGIAALIVVFHHVVLAFAPDFANGNIRYLGPDGLVPIALPDVLWSGNLSVCVFFVLSGYVLAPMTLASRSSIAGLILRRVVRLGMPVMAALAFAYAIWRLGCFANVEAGHESGSVGWLATFYNAVPHLPEIVTGAAVMPFKAIGNRYDPVVWTMHWEYLGSIGIFLLYVPLRRRRTIRIAATVALGMVVVHDYYFDFAAGALLADMNFATLANRWRPSVRRCVCAVLFLVALDLGLYIWSGGAGTAWHWLDGPGELLAGDHGEHAHILAAVLPPLGNPDLRAEPCPARLPTFSVARPGFLRTVPHPLSDTLFDWGNGIRRTT